MKRNESKQQSPGKKIFRKMTAWTLSVVMVLTMCVPTFASEIGEGAVVQDDQSVVQDGQSTVQDGQNTEQDNQTDIPPAPVVEGEEDALEPAPIVVEGEEENLQSAPVVVEGEEKNPKVKKASQENLGVGDVEVAEINGSQYTTLAGAIKAASTNTTTIKLIADVTESVTIAENQNITLDLNGKKLTNNGNDHTITNSGNLTIQDNTKQKGGKVYNNVTGMSVLQNDPGGIVEIKSGTLYKDMNTGDSDHYVITNHGTMTLTGGTISSMSSHSSCIENGWFDPTKNPSSEAFSIMTINGGTVTNAGGGVSANGGLYTLKNDDYGKLTINGGTFTNTTEDAGAVLNWNELTITGGTFTGKNASVSTMATNAGNNAKHNYQQGKTVIEGGVFTGHLGVSTNEKNQFQISVQVSGGFFNKDVKAAYLAEGYTCVQKQANSYVVTSSLSNKAFIDIQNQINDAEPNDIITLVEDIDITTTGLCIPEGKTITLDLAGNDIQGANGKYGQMLVLGNLTIKDSTDVSSSGDENGKIWSNTKYNGSNAINTGTSLIQVGNYDPQTQTSFGGTLTLESGLISALADGKNYSSHGNFGIGVFGSGIANINGGRIEAGWYAVCGNGNQSPKIQMNINGGTLISQADYAIYHPGDKPSGNGGTLHINGGTITGACGAVATRGGKTIIAGGTLSTLGKGSTEKWTDGTSGLGNAAINIDNAYGATDVKIYGGNFEGNSDEAAPSLAAGHGTSVSITGGSFSHGRDVVKLYISFGHIMEDGVVRALIQVSAVTISPSSVTLEEGDSAMVTAAVTPSNAENTGVTYTSSNNEIATVSSSGTIKAVKEGTATITAASVYSPNKSATCTVTVTKKEVIPDPEEPPKSNIIVEVEPEKDEEGVVVIPQEIPQQQKESIETAITEATTEDNIVLVLPQSEGTAPAVSTDIIQKAIDSNSDTLEIKSQPVEGDTESVPATFSMDLPKGTEIDASVQSINTGIKAAIDDKAEQIVSDKIPATASTMKLQLAHEGKFPVPVTITLDVEDKFKPGELVYIYYINKDTGAVEAVNGSPFTVQSDNTISFTLEHASSYVMSSEPEIVLAETVQLDKTSATVGADKTITLKATVGPENTTDKTVTWSSADSKIATVSTKGTVKGIKPGSTVITASTANGIKATCKVTVTVTKLSAPGGVKTASAGYDSIKVSWSKVSYAAKYTVYRATSKSGKYTNIGSTTGTSLTSKKLVTGKTYYYKVRASKDRIYSSYSKVVSGSSRPAAPSVSAKAGKKAVTISWKKVTGANSYTIYRATSKNGKYTRVTTTKGSSTLKYTDKKLKGGKTYYYKVRANRKTKSMAKTVQSASSKIVNAKTKK